ncbi:hypothetical protein [Polaribacter atrinae]|uniref:hypothetical protein n=1 Tax=Polaribacter atrinae TaxID=1333662 RepID=UPI0030FCA720
MKNKILAFSILIILFSCTSNDDQPEFYGLGDFSGNFRVRQFTPSIQAYCTGSSVDDSIDLIINSDDSFIHRKYKRDPNNNKCVYSETLTGKFTITHSRYNRIWGSFKYDNSDVENYFILNSAIDGKHDKIDFEFENPNTENPNQIFFYRID